MRGTRLAAALVWAISNLSGQSDSNSGHAVVLPSSKEVHTTTTASSALDRIDQRSPQPDQRFIRAGTGKGVIVYVFDDAIYPHPEIADHLIDRFKATDDTASCGGHGINVASVIAGKTLGVAPQAEIENLEIFSCKPNGETSSILRAAEFAVSDHVRRGLPAVANWSFSIITAEFDSTGNKMVDSAAKLLLDAGISVVVAAGNTNADACRLSPDNSPGVIVVGSSMIVKVRSTGLYHDERDGDTAWGHCIDLYAPGWHVLVATFDQCRLPLTRLQSGTSISAGFVSGAVALYLESHPQATPAEVKAYLKARATLNVVRNGKADTTRLLYVGIEP